MTIWFSDGAGRDETRDSLSDAESDLEPVAASNP